MREAMTETERKGGNWVKVRKEFSEAYETTGIQVGGMRRKGPRERNRG